MKYMDHVHKVGDDYKLHDHDRGDEDHRHVSRLGKTYFKDEKRSDGMPVKCEGHWTIDLDAHDDWCYPE